jgi:hypothetical protein
MLKTETKIKFRNNKIKLSYDTTCINKTKIK